MIKVASLIHPESIIKLSTFKKLDSIYLYMVQIYVLNDFNPILYMLELSLQQMFVSVIISYFYHKNFNFNF